MEQKNAPAKPSKKGQTREDRLKAALKANMGRRKAQAKTRAAKHTHAQADVAEHAPETQADPSVDQAETENKIKRGG